MECYRVAYEALSHVYRPWNLGICAWTLDACGIDPARLNPGPYLGWSETDRQACQTPPKPVDLIAFFVLSHPLVMPLPFPVPVRILATMAPLRLIGRWLRS